MTSVFTQNGATRSTWFKKRKKDENRNTLGRELDYLELDHAVKTDSDENRKRRTLNISKEDGQSWGFTLQSYGIHHTQHAEVEMLTYVDYVDFGGPAHIAGMQAGDVILSINGVSMETADHTSLIDYIRHQGNTMRLVVLFEDCVRKVELHLRLRKLKNLLAAKEFELRSLELREKRITDGFGSLSDSRWSLRSTKSTSNFTLPAHDSRSLSESVFPLHPASPLHSPDFRSGRKLLHQQALDRHESRRSCGDVSNMDVFPYAHDLNASLDNSYMGSIYGDRDGTSSPNMVLNPRVDLQYTSLPSNFRRKDKSESYVGKSTFYSPTQEEQNEFLDTDSVFGNEISRDLSVYQTWTGAAPELDRDSGIYNTWSGDRRKKRRGETRSIGNSLFYVESEENLNSFEERKDKNRRKKKQPVKPFIDQTELGIVSHDKPPDISYEQMGARPKSKYSTCSDSQLSVRHKKDKDAFSVKYRQQNNDNSQFLNSTAHETTLNNSLVTPNSARSRRPSSLPIIHGEDEVMLTPDITPQTLRDSGIESPVFLESRGNSVPSLDKIPADKLSHVKCDKNYGSDISLADKRNRKLEKEKVRDKRKDHVVEKSPKSSPLLNMKKVFTRSPSLPSLYSKSKWSPFEFTRNKLRNSLSKLRRKSGSYNLSDSKLSLPRESSDSKSGRSAIGQLIRSASTISIAQATSKPDMSSVEMYATLPKKSKFLSFVRRTKSAGNVMQNEQTQLKVKEFLLESEANERSTESDGISVDADHISIDTFDIDPEVTSYDERMSEIESDEEQTTERDLKDADIENLEHGSNSPKERDNEYISEFQKLSNFDFQTPSEANDSGFVCEVIAECTEPLEISENDERLELAVHEPITECSVNQNTSSQLESSVKDEDGTESVQMESLSNNEKYHLKSNDMPLENDVSSIKSETNSDSGSVSQSGEKNEFGNETEETGEADDALDNETSLENCGTPVPVTTGESEKYSSDNDIVVSGVPCDEVSLDSHEEILPDVDTNCSDNSVREFTHSIKDSNSAQIHSACTEFTHEDPGAICEMPVEISVQSVILDEENDVFESDQICDTQDSVTNSVQLPSEISIHDPNNSIESKTDSDISCEINEKATVSTENDFIPKAENTSKQTELDKSPEEIENVTEVREGESQVESETTVQEHETDREKARRAYRIRNSMAAARDEREKLTQKKDVSLDKIKPTNRSRSRSRNLDMPVIPHKETEKLVIQPRENRTSRLRSRQTKDVKQDSSRNTSDSRFEKLKKMTSKSQLTEGPVEEHRKTISNKDERVTPRRKTRLSDSSKSNDSDSKIAKKDHTSVTGSKMFDANLIGVKERQKRFEGVSPENINRTPKLNSRQRKTEAEKPKIKNEPEKPTSEISRFNKSSVSKSRNTTNKSPKLEIPEIKISEVKERSDKHLSTTFVGKADLRNKDYSKSKNEKATSQSDRESNMIQSGRKRPTVERARRDFASVECPRPREKEEAKMDPVKSESEKQMSESSSVRNHANVSKMLSTPARLSTAYGAKIRSRSKSPLALRYKARDRSDVIPGYDVEQPILGYSYKPRASSFTSTVIENRTENSSKVNNSHIGQEKMHEMIKNSIIKAAVSRRRSFSENSYHGSDKDSNRSRASTSGSDTSENCHSNQGTISNPNHSPAKRSIEADSNQVLDMSIKSAYENGKNHAKISIYLNNIQTNGKDDMKDLKHKALKQVDGNVPLCNNVQTESKPSKIVESRITLSNVIQMCMDRDGISGTNTSVARTFNPRGFNPKTTVANGNQRKPIIAPTNDSTNRERYFNYINKHSCETQL